MIASIALLINADLCLQDLFREVVRKFIQEQVAPQQAAFEEAGQPNREVWKALGSMVGGDLEELQIKVVFVCRGCWESTLPKTWAASGDLSLMK